MCPEYGATIAIFPIDEMTLDYLRLTGRDASQRRARRGVREGAGPVPRRADAPEPVYTEHDRARSRDRRAEPRRPEAPAGSRAAEEREAASFAQPRCRDAEEGREEAPPPAAAERRVAVPSRRTVALEHGSVVIAAITSCTNTSNPSVMIGAGLVAKKAVERGLTRSRG